MRDFLICCFQKDPQHRPSAMELLRHEWLATAFAAEGDVSRLWATSNELSVNNLASFTSLNRSDNCLPAKAEVDYVPSRNGLTRFNTRRGSLPARKTDQVHIVHHSFLKTTFEKGKVVGTKCIERVYTKYSNTFVVITCKVCEDDIKKHGMFCEGKNETINIWLQKHMISPFSLATACAIVCHDKCRSLAPHCVNATRFSDKERRFAEMPACKQLAPIPTSIPSYIPTSRQVRSPYLTNNAAVSSSNVNVLSSAKRPINLRRKSRPESDNCIIS
jgi:hypothetical protein